MNTKMLLDQLLRSGTEFLNNGNAAAPGAGQAQSPVGQQSPSNGGLGDLLSGSSGKLIAGSVLGLLLGSKKGRKVGGKVLKYGSLAALATMAYQAYNRSQGGASGQTAPNADFAASGSDDDRALAVLKAIIGAAKADGHIDDQERALIDEALGKMTQDDALQTWVRAELAKPVDPADVAAAADSAEMASEMYLASVLVVDEENFMEKSYLDELARQLKLDPALKTELEAEVRQV